uniref:(northern house mosquito) hypothetical protein n=1 Tax=Culex pipiens TaxID=7175 RepID=A0A8D8FJJ1_CULPI
MKLSKPILPSNLQSCLCFVCLIVESLQPFGLNNILAHRYSFCVCVVLFFVFYSKFQIHLQKKLQTNQDISTLLQDTCRCSVCWLEFPSLFFHNLTIFILFHLLDFTV